MNSPRRIELARALSRAWGAAAWLLYERTVVVLAVMWSVGVAVVLWHVDRLQSKLVETAAMQGAALHSETIEELRTLYTSEVVERVQRFGIDAAHDYREKDRAIPLPATLTIDLGKRVHARGSGIQVRLYSAYPFPWRTDGGPRDEFERDALAQLEAHPDRTVMRFEDFSGHSVLRYATADRMRPQCVRCHNTHPASPKVDWREGDVRGVLEIIRPLDPVIATTRTGLGGTFVLIGAISLLGLSALGLVVGKLRRTSSELERRVLERTAALQEASAALRESETGLRRSRDELEQRVRERTAELEQTLSALRQGEEQFHAFMDNSPVVAFLLDEEERLLYANQPYCRKFNVRREDFGKKADFIPPEFLRQYMENFQAALAKGETIEAIETYPRADGTLGYGLVYKFPLRDAAGRLLLGGVGIDITEHKRAEEALRESEARFRTLVENAPEAIVVLDVEERRFVDANENAVRLFGLPREALLQTGPAEMSPPIQPDGRASHESAVEKIHQAVAGGTPVFEWTHRNAAGEDSPCEVRLVRLPASGRVLVRGSVTDITDRKRTEQQLRESLKEKEVLLAEIHHRVKNNLQIIQSLLELQLARLKDPAVREELRESQNRVQSMTLVHENLYQSGNLAELDFAVHVENLCGHLFDSYGVDVNQIQLTLQIAEVRLELDRAILCTLIINELISNSLKYAFPGGRRGQILVAFHKQEEGQYTLRVRDDGVGLPPDLDLQRTTSLGWQIVCGLTRQLGGTLTVARDQGLTVAIDFSAPAPKR